METHDRRASVLALAENAVGPLELERALVALAEFEADHPGDADVHGAHVRLVGQFAAAAPAPERGGDGWAEWRLRVSTETGGAGLL